MQSVGGRRFRFNEYSFTIQRVSCQSDCNEQLANERLMQHASPLSASF